MSQNPLFVYVPMVHSRPIRETAPAGARTASVSHNTILPDLIDKIAAAFTAGLKPDTFKLMKSRLERGLKMAKDGSVSVTAEPARFLVSSASVKNRQYKVDLEARTCSCPDSRKGNTRKHRIASYYIQQALFQSAPEGDPLQVDPQAPSIHDTIVWGVANLDSETAIPVEILEINDGHVSVRALPEMVDGKFRPCFPFESPFPDSDVRWSSAVLPREFIDQVKVFPNQRSIPCPQN